MSAAPVQQVGERSFTCDACGRKFRWKADLAGRKARCKCGGVVDIPLQPPTVHGAYVDPTIFVTPGGPPAPTELLTGNHAPPRDVDWQVESPPAPPSAASRHSAKAAVESDAESEGGKGAIASIVAGLIFVGLGVWQWLDPHDPADTSGGRRRLLRIVLGWVDSIAGNIGVVVLLVGLGLLLIGAGVYGLRGKSRST